MIPILKKGDRIAIISPASAVKSEYIDNAVKVLSERGYIPEVMPHARGRIDGNYSATVEERAEDLLSALIDPRIRCILCARGGYGAVHLLPYISRNLVKENPKWLVGFSDISVLHSYWQICGLESLHAPMAKDIGTPCGEMTLQVLETGRLPHYFFDNSPEIANGLPENIPGKARGVLIGGNLAVLNALAATNYDMISGPESMEKILFVEDIAEPVYKIERIFYQMYLQGVFTRISGLIVGHFTEYTHPEGKYAMELMISRFLKRFGIDGIPVVYRFPAGHISDNHPLLLGSEVTLTATHSTITLTSL